MDVEMRNASLRSLGTNNQRYNSIPTMTRNISANVERTDLQAVTECGPIRAMRLERDLGIGTIESLAKASIDQLCEIWSVGEWTAKRMKGSAQGHLEALKEDAGTPRIYVSMPGDAPEQVTPTTLASLLEATIEKHGHELGSDALKVGYPRGVFDDEGKMYEFMDLWSSRYEGVEVFGFDVHFGEFVDDMDDASSEEYAEAFQDRRERGLNWAQEVAIPLDDKHTGYFIYCAQGADLDVTVGRRRFEEQGDIVWDAASDVDEEATFVDDPVGHDDADIQSDPEWDVGATPGREADVADPVDKYLSLEPNDQDDPRLDHDDLEGADPGGDGDPTSGKKSWSTGS